MQSYSLHPASSFLPDGPKYTQPKAMFSVARPPSTHENNQDAQGLVDNFSGHIYASQPSTSGNLPPQHTSALPDFLTNRPNPYPQYNYQRNESYFPQNQYQPYAQIWSQDNNFRMLYSDQAQIYTGANVFNFYF